MAAVVLMKCDKRCIQEWTMIRIRYSIEPFGEVEIEGSSSDLADLRDKILQFCECDNAALDVIAASTLNPSPYERSLAGLRVRKTSERVVISVKDEFLVLAGAVPYLSRFAENLPYDAEPTSDIAYHVHFDRLGREDCVSEDSLDIVLALKR